MEMSSQLITPDQSQKLGAGQWLIPEAKREKGPREMGSFNNEIEQKSMWLYWLRYCFSTLATSLV